MQSESVTTALNAAIKANGADLVLVAPPCPDCVFWRPLVMRDHTGGIRGFRMCWVSHGSSAAPMKPDFSCFAQKAVSTPDSGPSPAPAPPGPVQPVVPAAVATPADVLKAEAAKTDALKAAISAAAKPLVVPVAKV